MKEIKKVQVGNYILGDGIVRVQSMLNVPSYDVEGNVKQAIELEKAGCEIIRVAVPDKAAAKIIKELKNNVKMPVVADIHFDYKLALEALENGADKIRINPGNIGSKDRVKTVVSACKERNVPIRIGVNGGSLEKDILNKYQKLCPEALVESAEYHIHLLEDENFDNIVVSMKASDVNINVNACRLFREKYNYPIHIGVTEAGTERMGIIKNSIGIGSLLLDGIGETIRVSLTAEPVKEIYAAYDILNCLGVRKTKPEVVSCPTCGRTRVNLIELANEIEDKLSNVNKAIKVAVMGCAVNGPGEARDADIGVACGDDCGLIIKKGEILRKVKQDEIVKELLDEIKKL